VVEGDRTQLGRSRLLVAVVIPAIVVLAVQLQPSEAETGAVTATTVPATISIAVTGEILPHPSVVDHAARAGAATGRAHDFAPMFADLRTTLQGADLSICHLEVPVAPPGAPLSGYPSFAIPAEVGVGIGDSGWDRCSTASNHSNDQGTAGIRATLDALDAGGVGHSGTARTAQEAADVPIVDVGPFRVAHLSSTWGFNALPPAERWMADVTDPDRILAVARRARAAGATLVVVSLHWGDEYDPGGNADQRRLADRLLSSPDVDLVVGHGPHVLQPIESFHGKVALLSVGNLVANQGRERPATYDGVVATVTFSRGQDGRLRAAAPVVQPTWYDPGAGRVRLVLPALADPALAPVHGELAASLARTRGIMGPFVPAG
jgi:hypothetical protein